MSSACSAERYDPRHILHTAAVGESDLSKSRRCRKLCLLKRAKGAFQHHGLHVNALRHQIEAQAVRFLHPGCQYANCQAAEKNCVRVAVDSQCGQVNQSLSSLNCQTSSPRALQKDRSNLTVIACLSDCYLLALCCAPNHQSKGSYGNLCRSQSLLPRLQQHHLGEVSHPGNMALLSKTMSVEEISSGYSDDGAQTVNVQLPGQQRHGGLDPTPHNSVTCKH